MKKKYLKISQTLFLIVALLSFVSAIVAIVAGEVNTVSFVLKCAEVILLSLMIEYIESKLATKE